MKEVKYNGDLKSDLKFKEETFSLKSRVDLKILRGLLLASFVLLFAATLSQGLSTPIFVALMGSFGVAEVLMYRGCIKKQKEDIHEAKSRLNDFIIKLEDHDVFVPDLDLVNMIEMEKKEAVSLYQEKGNYKNTVIDDELIRYWSFLDKRNKKIQVLKYIKTNLMENETNKFDEKYFLLEDQDKDILNEPLKKVLKINK